MSRSLTRTVISALFFRCVFFFRSLAAAAHRRPWCWRLVSRPIAGRFYCDGFHSHIRPSPRDRLGSVRKHLNKGCRAAACSEPRTSRQNPSRRGSSSGSRCYCRWRVDIGPRFDRWPEGNRGRKIFVCREKSEETVRAAVWRICRKRIPAR